MIARRYNYSIYCRERLRSRGDKMEGLDKRAAKAIDDIEKMLRREYGNDIRIRRTLPSNKELQETDSFLELVGQALGIHRWMWKTRKGLLIAIVLLPIHAVSYISTVRTMVTAGYDLAAPYIDAAARVSVEFCSELIAFLPEPDRPFNPAYVDRAAIIPADLGSRPLLAKASVAAFDTSGFVPQLPRINFVGRLYRIVFSQYAGDPFLPPLIASTWSKAGGILYAAESLTTAIVETLVRTSEENYQSPPMIARDEIEGRSLIEFEFNGTAIFVDEVGARELGFSLDDRRATEEFGSKWLSSKATDALIVPSKRIPNASLVLLNPQMVRETAQLLRILPLSVAG